MPQPIVCLDEDVRRFAERFRPQFSKPQYQYSSLTALETTLPHVAGRVEFPGLEHGESNNPSQTNRGSKPELVAQELRQFFTRP